mgnify:CR=1 FL=1
MFLIINMTSEIARYLDEIENIKYEIGRFKLGIKKLKARQADIEKELQKYIREKNQPGFKYNNIVVTLDNRNKIKRKTKKQKEEDQIEALRKLGITNPNEVIQVLAKSGKGNVVEYESVKIKNLKK